MHNRKKVVPNKTAKFNIFKISRQHITKTIWVLHNKRTLRCPIKSVWGSQLNK